MNAAAETQLALLQTEQGLQSATSEKLVTIKGKLAAKLVDENTNKLTNGH